MKYVLIMLFLISSVLFSQELKVVADSFKADESSGISVFSGDVKITRDSDELNAFEVTIYTDKKNKPTKFIAVGSVSFKIKTKQNAKYEGIAGRVVYLPKKKEYYFFDNVHLKQIDDKKEILGDEVVLNITDGKAYAKGLKKEPVIMIFDIEEDKE